ncbi:MAG: HXXEE domain-containing protein, partial [Ignavibacteria bacterium]|nr:HXXEE domain-containing protein [Ignavibacteria bacterium]
MTSQPTDRASFPPRVALLLPVVLLLHQADEWFGGFPEWTRYAVGNGVTDERFLLINAVGFVLFTISTLVAFRERRVAWIVASLAALMGLNGVLHAVASMMVDRYSPGTATGLLLSLPLSIVVLRAAVGALPRGLVFGAIAAGILFHSLV